MLRRSEEYRVLGSEYDLLRSCFPTLHMGLEASRGSTVGQSETERNLSRNCSPQSAVCSLQLASSGAGLGWVRHARWSLKTRNRVLFVLHYWATVQLPVLEFQNPKLSNKLPASGSSNTVGAGLAPPLCISCGPCPGPWAFISGELIVGLSGMSDTTRLERLRSIFRGSTPTSSMTEEDLRWRDGRLFRKAVGIGRRNSQLRTVLHVRRFGRVHVGKRVAYLVPTQANHTPSSYTTPHS